MRISDWSSDVCSSDLRLSRFANVEVREGDMHALPCDDDSFDLVVLMHALTYAAKPAQAVAEAARVLRPGGQLLLSSLARHGHRAAVEDRKSTRLNSSH